MSEPDTFAPVAGEAVIDGVRLETSWIGPRPEEGRALGPHAPPALVFLHEGLGSVSMWRDFPARLARASGCGALVWSRQGYGKSDPVPLPRPLSYMHDEAFNVLGKLLDHYGISRAVLVGHSDGASIAAIYAGGVDDHRVRGLILMAPHFFVEDVSVASIAEARTAFETTDLRDRLSRHHGSNVDCAFRGWNGAWLDPGFRRWDITEYLPYIRVPMLIIQGEDDEYGTARQLDAAMEDCQCPVETVLLSECGHAPFRDQPQATLDAAADFLARLAAIDSAPVGGG